MDKQNSPSNINGWRLGAETETSSTQPNGTD